MDIVHLNKKIKEPKAVILRDIDEIKYMKTPIGKALYNKYNNPNKKIKENQREETNIKEIRKVGRPRKEKRCHWTDRVKCPICGIEFIRSGRTNHKKSKLHKFAEKLNEKFKNLILKD